MFKIGDAVRILGKQHILYRDIDGLEFERTGMGFNSNMVPEIGHIGIITDCDHGERTYEVETDICDFVWWWEEEWLVLFNKKCEGDIL